ncbi:MAG: hypothetical protein H7836_14440 [Magnetococcus sp. YQC-3]
MMTRILSVALLISGLALSAAWAGTVAEATRMSLLEARENLASLLAAPDREDQNRRVEAIKRTSAKVDVLIEKNPESLQALHGPWTAFKSTRDGEIIPHLLNGRQEKATELATGIQAERFQQMLDMLSTLPQ